MATFEAQRGAQVQDVLFKALLTVAGLIVLITLSAILLILFNAGWQAFAAFGPSFIWSSDWNPPLERYGALPAIVGTLVTSAIAIVIAWPIGFGVAYFLTETCPRVLRAPLGIAIELLAAVPSIVYGMWGFFVLAPFMSAPGGPQEWMTTNFSGLPVVGVLFQAAPLGVGLLTAGIVLAIMILPFIAAATRDVLLTTPQILKDGGYAMGATRWEVLVDIVLPAARASLFGAVFLGLGRALGETMAVTFVIGNANRLPDSLYAPAASIASIVANEFPDSEQGSLKFAALFALGFILFVVSFFVLALARILLRQERMV
ncbi:MAG: phosphate ABC transporter permease subunit PstC [Hyphomonadaceae bacterium]